MKILLINHPYLKESSDYGKPTQLAPAPSPGIGYIGAVLKQAGYNVKIIDAFYYSWEKVEDIIKRENPNVVGVGCMTEGRKNAFKVVELTKKINPNIKVVMGGPHPTHCYEQVLKYYPVDAIVIGEGEITIVELIKSWEEGKDLKEVKGIAFKNNGEVYKNTQREFIKDLDTIPFPLYRDFDWNSYVKKDFAGEIADVEINGKKLSELPYCFMITSRGCPYRCQFCATTKFWGAKWRLRSAKNVVDEVELLYHQYGRRYFNFCDDAFSIKEQRVIDICKEILSRGLKIVFNCVTRVDYASIEMANWLKKAGCIYVALGVESGSPKILKTIHKKITLEQIENTFNVFHKAGILPGALLMVGNPGESNETINQTLKLLKKIKPPSTGASITMVFPDTELFEIAKQKGLLTDEYWLKDTSVPFYTAEHSLATLIKWQDKIYRFGEHYRKKLLKERILHKIRVARRIFAARTGVYISKRGIHRFKVS